MKIGEGGGCQNLSAIYNHNKTQLHEMPQLKGGFECGSRSNKLEVQSAP